MVQGGGNNITNYDPNKPSYAYTTSTTEFDDELIRRKILSHEDTIVAKGATRQEASRLVKEQQEQAKKKNANESISLSKLCINDDDNNDDSDSDDDDEYLDGLDDDEFMARYREQRMEEMKQQQSKQQKGKPYYGSVIPISRDEWTRQVNEDSRNNWVVVCLTSSNTEFSTGCTERACRELAVNYPLTKFVSIASHHAIPNFPSENLPCLFCYYDGQCQHQLLQPELKHNITTTELEIMLRKLSVIQMKKSTTTKKKNVSFDSTT